MNDVFATNTRQYMSKLIVIFYSFSKILFFSIFLSHAASVTAIFGFTSVNLLTRNWQFFG